jgi:peptidoglycan/LPS O-acetylase OafA/YrhL
MTGERIEGIDLWRALLVLTGLFVHASFQLPRVALFEVVEGASQAFRMGAFFAISGLLAAGVLQRRRPLEWLAGRAMQLGVPAIVGLATLSPLIWLLVASAPRAAGRMPLPFEWHHLWFLYALSLYSLVAVGLDALDRRHALAARIEARVHGPASARVSMLLVALASATLIGAATAIMRQMLPGWALLPFVNLQLMAGYLPMFMLGFALGRCGQLRREYARAGGFALAVVAAAGVAFAVAYAAPMSSEWQARARFAAVVLCPPAAFALILRSALAIRRTPPALRRVADASYTIYVLHLPIAAAINTRVGPMLDPHLAYALCAATAGAVSYGLHVGVVSRVPLLALLVNGRPVRRREAALA